MPRIKFNVSAATVVDICGIRANESADVVFTNDTSDWPSTNYSFKLYTNRKKEGEIDLDARITKNPNNVLTITVDPTADSIAAGEYYYEIYDADNKRVIFNGKLDIDA